MQKIQEMQGPKRLLRLATIGIACLQDSGVVGAIFLCEPIPTSCKSCLGSSINPLGAHLESAGADQARRRGPAERITD